MPRRDEDVGALVRCVLRRVDAVVHDRDPAGIDSRVGGEDVVAHPGRDRDHGVGGLQCRPLRPGGQRVPPPSCSAFQGRRGSRLWVETTCGHSVQELGHVTGQVRVPGVAVHDVGARAARRHLQVDAEGAQCRIGALEPGRIGVGRDACLVPLSAETVDAHVDVRAQLAGQVLHVHARPAVHLRRVLAGQLVDPGAVAGAGERRQPVCPASHADPRAAYLPGPWLPAWMRARFRDRGD